MAKRNGSTTRAWAEGPGRQSGLWALSAAAVASLPFLDSVRPACGGSFAACTTTWERLFFVPDLLFMPAVLAILVMSGSWIAQRRHGRFNKHYYDNLDPKEVPEIPPGHLRPMELERDLVRRTLAWCGGAALASVALFAYFATTPIGMRACDPVRFRQPTGLQQCSGPAQWSDALIAYEVWVVLLAALVWSVILFAKARRLREPKEKTRPSLLRRRAVQSP